MFKLEEYAYPKILPWDQIFKDLYDAGKTPSDISELIGVKWSTLARWRQGTEPKDSYARAILTIHARYCGESLTEIRLSEAVDITQKR